MNIADLAKIADRRRHQAKMWGLLGKFAEKYSKREFMAILNEIEPFLWREGRTYPNTIAQLNELFANGEVAFTFNYCIDNELGMFIEDTLSPTPIQSAYQSMLKDKIEKVISEEIPAKVAADQKYQNAMKNNDKKTARVEHDAALKRAVTGLVADHTELFKQFVDNESFRGWLADTMFGLTYRPQGAAGSGAA